MLSARRKRLVGALEYMKGSVDDAFNAYHEGTQNAVQSKLRLWADLADALQRVDEHAFAEVGWLRVELPHDGVAITKLTKALPEVLSLRYVGPRAPEGPAIAYVAVHVRSAVALAQLVGEIALVLGFPVRDWSFGCQQGGSK